MAFTPIALQIEEILNTDFIPDAFTKTNSNFVEIQGNFEDLINTLQIDYVNAIIGVTAPIQSINTQSIKLNAGSLVYVNSSGSQVGSLALDNNNLSVLTVNSIINGSGITTANITSTGTATLNNITIGGTINLNGATTATASPAITPQNLTVSLTYNTSTNIAEGTVTLTNTSSKNLFLTLSADAATYTGSFNPSILGVNIKIALDGTNPPADGSQFTFALVGFVSGSTSIIANWASLNKPINLVPSSTLAIQDNAVGTLASPITFSNTLFKSNITFLKSTFSSIPRLLIVSEKNMTDLN
jgi:hypothetical protein